MNLWERLRPGFWLRALWRRHPMLAVAAVGVPLLLLLSILNPALGILRELSRLAVLLVRPLLEGPGGRFLLLNLVLLAVLLLLYWRGRGRIRALLGALALRRFLAGLGRLAVRDCDRAARCFRSVLRLAGIADLERAVPALREIAAEARLKLALALVGQGELAAALRQVEMLRGAALSTRLRKEAAEVRAMLTAHEGGFVEETILKELASALEGDPRNPRLLRALRERRRAAGDTAGALQAQERLLEALGRTAPPAERALLAALALGEAREARARNERKRARALLRRALDAEPAFVPARLLLGDLEWEAGSRGAALAEWGRAGGPEALERAGEAFRSGMELRELVRAYPYPAVLLLVAEHYRSRGEHRCARRALEKAEALGLLDPALHRLWGDIWEEEGRPEEARRQHLRALAEAARG